MVDLSEKEFKHFKQKYGKRLDGDLTGDDRPIDEKIESKEFVDFVNEMRTDAPTWYEKSCRISEVILKIKPDKEKAVLLQESIDMAHLEITPAGAVSFSILAPIILIVFGGILGFALFNSVFMLVFFLFAGLSIIVPLSNMPHYYAAMHRMKASNQMVQCIFYVVTYMRHTSNIENAVEFASEHLAPPLSYDLRKVLWNVETEEYESVRESLDAYLQVWRKSNMEFVEAFHLIESSLYESSEDRRLALLDKSLDVMLDETYEKMLHYAQNLKSPITTLHMLGVILPILGLVILPLVVSFMQDVAWYHIALLYNVALPLLVYFMGKNILINRPTGYGETDMSAAVRGTDEVKLKFGSGVTVGVSIKSFCIFIFFAMLFIGFSPLIIHAIYPNFDIVLPGAGSFLEYKESITTEGVIKGPYGIGASILSFFVPLAFAVSIGIYYKMKAQDIIKVRAEAKKLENEFASALFQLGNRLGDGIPVEIAFYKVAEVMEGTNSGTFFDMVSMNIRRLGMGVQDAIFNPQNGALLSYPSAVIRSSMKVLIQASTKGSEIAAQAVLNISRYIKEIHRVDERLKDLMADIISSMNSQIKFLTPVISGIVIGITSMITGIIGKLGVQLRESGSIAGEGGGVSSIAGMFGDGLPTFYFQIIVGLYVVQITYILTTLANTIENGNDKVSESYNLGLNMLKSPIFYAIISIVIMIIFNSVATGVLNSTMSG